MAPIARSNIAIIGAGKAFEDWKGHKKKGDHGPMRPQLQMSDYCNQGIQASRILERCA